MDTGGMQQFDDSASGFLAGIIKSSSAADPEEIFKVSFVFP